MTYGGPTGMAAMSTATRDSTRAPLPQVGRGEGIFGMVAVVVSILALIVKLSGIFG